MKGRGRRPILPPPAATAVLVGMGVLAGLLVLARTATWGVGLSADSAAYIAVARNLIAGNGFLNFNGAPYAEWPPLYPLLLAAFGAFSDPAAVAAPLNALAHGLTVFVVGSHLSHRLGFRFGLAAAGALTLCIPLASLAARALSDSLLLLWAVLALTCASRFLTEGSVRAFSCMALFSALACLTRYVGVAVPIAIGFALLGHRSNLANMGVLRRVGYLFGYVLIVATPMAIWSLHNPPSTGKFAALRDAPDERLVASGFEVLGFVGGWIVGADVFSQVGRVALAAVFVVGLAIAGAVVSRKGQRAGGGGLAASVGGVHVGLSGGDSRRRVLGIHMGRVDGVAAGSCAALDSAEPDNRFRFARRGTVLAALVCCSRGHGGLAVRTGPCADQCLGNGSPIRARDASERRRCLCSAGGLGGLASRPERTRPSQGPCVRPCCHPHGGMEAIANAASCRGNCERRRCA